MAMKTFTAVPDTQIFHDSLAPNANLKFHKWRQDNAGDSNAIYLHVASSKKTTIHRPTCERYHDPTKIDPVHDVIHSNTKRPKIASYSKDALKEFLKVNNLPLPKGSCDRCGARL